MKLFASVIVAFIAAAPVSAFTNGTLVPSYICHPTPDGKPKSFGQLLPYMKKTLRTAAIDPNPGDDVAIPRLNTTNTTILPNSAYILASFHNSPNTVLPIQQGVNVTTANGGPLIAGQANQLIISSQIAGVELVGVLLYANNAKGQREGDFIDQGGMNIFVNFSGCGLNRQGKISGVIQQTSVAKNGTYKQLFYNAPRDLQGNITIAGLSVTNSGFGVWSYPFKVVAPSGGALARVAIPSLPSAAIPSLPAELAAVLPSSLIAEIENLVTLHKAKRS